MTRDATATTVRLATPADAAAVAAIYAPVVRETTISFELDPPDEAEMARRIERTTERLPWLVATHGGEVVGYVYASPFAERPAYRWSVDISVYVAADAHRAGVATGLYGALFSLLRLQGVVTAYAAISLPNPESVALHEGLGFEPVGTYRGVGFKHDDWRDVGHWSLALVDRPDAPDEPIPVDEVVDTPAAREAMADAAETIDL